MDPTAARKKIIMIMAIVALVMIVGGAVFHRDAAAIPFALGVILTTVLNAYKLSMIEKAATKITEIDDEARGKNTASAQYLLRYLVTIAVFLIAAFVPFIDVIGAIFGVFTMPIAIYSWRLVSKEA